MQRHPCLTARRLRRPRKPAQVDVAVAVAVILRLAVLRDNALWAYLAGASLRLPRWRHLQLREFVAAGVGKVPTLVSPRLSAASDPHQTSRMLLLLHPVLMVAAM